MRSSFIYTLTAINAGGTSAGLTLKITVIPSGGAIHPSGSPGGTFENSLRAAVNDLAGMRVYPNPWRASRDAGGKAPWNLANDSGARVASGIYLYLITDGQGNKTRGKFTVIR